MSIFFKYLYHDKAGVRQSDSVSEYPAGGEHRHAAVAGDADCSRSMAPGVFDKPTYKNEQVKNPQHSCVHRVRDFRQVTLEFKWSITAGKDDGTGEDITNPRSEFLSKEFENWLANNYGAKPRSDARLVA